jgi:hypothetical protein
LPLFLRTSDKDKEGFPSLFEISFSEIIHVKDRIIREGRGRKGLIQHSMGMERQFSMGMLPDAMMGFP